MFRLNGLQGGVENRHQMVGDQRPTSIVSHMETRAGRKEQAPQELDFRVHGDIQVSSRGFAVKLADKAREQPNGRYQGECENDQHEWHQELNDCPANVAEAAMANSRSRIHRIHAGLRSLSDRFGII